METYKEYLIKEGEDYDDYGYRLYKNKPLYGLNKDEIGEILNQQFPPRKDESTRRKDFASYIRGFDKGYEKGLAEANVDKGILAVQSLTPKSHFKRMSEIIGEYNLRKRDMQLERNELAKMMREVTPYILITEAYVESLEANKIPIPEFKYNTQIDKGESIIKLLPADWHIGVEINESYNQYNYEIAIRRIDRYCEKAIEFANLYNATTISITHLGDIVEHFDMRTTQKFDCEFTMSQQLVHAQDLFMRMITNLTDNSLNVEISGVYGNHCRMNGSKHDAISKDNAMYVILENMKKQVAFAEKMSNKKINNIKFIEPSDYGKYQAEEIYNSLCRWQHGDDVGKNDQNKIEKYIGTDGRPYTLVGFGHLHHYRVINHNRNEKEFYMGCLQGSNEYGKNKVKSLADASQGLIVFRNNGEILPFDINLQ